MLTTDLKCLINVLCGKPCDCSNLDWYAALGFLQLNRVAGRFYRVACERELLLPPGVAAHLAGIAEYQRMRNRKMLFWLKKICHALNRIEIPYAVLKGNVLVHADFDRKNRLETVRPLYELGERASNDIDLLVLPKDVGKVEKALMQCGFTQGYYDAVAHDIRTVSRKDILERRMNRGETVPFQRILQCEQLRHIEIDINFSLDYLSNGMKEILEKMLARTQIYLLRTGGTVRSLETVDFLIHLILHQYKEMRVYSMVMRGKDLQFYKLLDLYLMLQRIPHDSLFHRIKEYGIEEQAAAVLKTLTDVFENLQLESGLKDLAQSSFSQAELVLDPTEGNRSYVWTAEAWEKLQRFDHTGMLVQTT